MEEAKEGLRYARSILIKTFVPLALDDEDLKSPWDWISGMNSRQGFPSAGLFPLLKEVLNLVEVFETVNFTRAIGRFINQQAAVVSGPHVSGWRSSQTTAKDLCFVAQLTVSVSDLVGVARLNVRPALGFYKTPSN